LGSGQLMFESDLVGKKAGDKFETVIRLPNDYRIESLANKSVTVSVEIFFVKNIKRTKLVFRCGSPWKYELNSFSNIIKTLIVKATKAIVIKSCDKVVYNSFSKVERFFI